MLPFALPQRTVVAAAPAARRAVDGLVGAVRRDRSTFGADELDEPGRVTGWAAYVAGVVWALREAGLRRAAAPGWRIASDVPLGAGLSSSAALEAAVLTALVDLGGLDLPSTSGRRLAQRAENVYVGAPTGIMDQSAVDPLPRRARAVPRLPSLERRAHPVRPGRRRAGRAGHRQPRPAPARRRRVRRPPRRLRAGRRGCSGVPALRDVAVADLDAALARLDDDEIRRRVRHVVTEDQRVLDTVALLRAGRVREIGPLLTASHASMRDDFEITVPEIDTAVEAALAAGAYGARMTGGGFGGCVLALVDADARRRGGRRGRPPPTPSAASPPPAASRSAPPPAPPASTDRRSTPRLATRARRRTCEATSCLTPALRVRRRGSIGRRRSTIMPAATVRLVASSMRMKPPVVRLRRYSSASSGTVVRSRTRPISLSASSVGRLVAVQRVDVEPVVQAAHDRPRRRGWCA